MEIKKFLTDFWNEPVGFGQMIFWITIYHIVLDIIKDLY